MRRDRKSKTQQTRDTHLRDAQVRECVHVLRARSFKLFRTGDYVSVYNLSVREPGAPAHTKMQVLVPHNYPVAPVKVAFTTPRDRSNLITKNFNSMAKRCKDQLTILELLNTLVYSLDEFASDNYQRLAETKHKWLSQL